MKKTLTEEEQEHEDIRKLSTLQKVAWQIILKWRVLLLSTFSFCSVAFSLYIVWHFATSSHRFDASTRLSYMPRKVARVENLNDKQLYSVLERPSLKRRVGQILPMSTPERECLTFDLQIIQERKPPNIYTLRAQAPSKLAAIMKVNAYAKVLIAEYKDYRSRDLTALRESISVRKDRIREQLSELDSEETIIKGKSGVASPIEALTAINALLSDERRDLALLKVQTLNEEVKQRRLQDIVGESGPTIQKNSALIREKKEKLAALDAEIAALRELYTDINPKVLGKLEDRQALMDEYATFLKANGIEGMTLDEVGQVEKASSELSEVKLRLDVLEESRRSLEQSIKDNEERSAKLTTVIPALERVNGQRRDLELTMRNLDDQIGEIDYLQMAMTGDLNQIERSGGATDNNPMKAKNFILAIAAALFCTCALCFWILMLELLRGSISGPKELAAYDDIMLIGSLPAPGVLPEHEEQDILGVAALNFCKSDVPKSIVLVCRLPGVPEQPAFASATDWSLSMSGKRAFLLEIVKSAEFEPPDGAEPLISAFKKENRGWFPVENRYMLVSSELEMLQADLAMLKNDFDVIFLKMPEGIRRGGSFFSQLLEICDSVLLLVGAQTTKRSWLSYARHCIANAQKPTIGLMTGVGAKIAEHELEVANG